MRLLLTLLFAISLSSLAAQGHVCGTSDHDQLLMESLTRAGGPSTFSSINRGDKVYIPIAFHIVKPGNGIGGVKQGDILAQICKLNQDYAKWDIIFYPINATEYPIIRGDQAYNLPRENENTFRLKKNPSALNVFVTGDIGDSGGGGGGIVLGYYSPSNDLIVCRVSEINASSFTLTHEIGHFFSLRHPFFAWESTLYSETVHGNPLDVYQSPDNPNIPVELVNGSNCTVAGDEVCDTPPDYNFAFGPYDTGCALNIKVYDSNNELVKTMYDNVMTYHSQCPTELFTQGQIDRFLVNYNRSSRDFLKSNYVPNETVITESPVIISPAQDSKVETYDGVYIEWEGVENADHYLIEFKGGTQGALEYYTDEPYFYATELEKKNFYFFKVYAFNDGYQCLAPVSGRFSTGEGTTSTLDQAIFSNIAIAPNPARDLLHISIESDFVENNVSFTLTDIAGRRVYNSFQKINTGNNIFSIDLTNCNSGIHFATVTTSKGSITQKVSVVK